MKNLLYIITVILTLTSCRSIDKMIESGNYDQALRYGVDKLIGKKNKKNKHVKGLEKAYSKLTEHDNNEIDRLTLANNKNSMDRVVRIYQEMLDRQNYINPLLPLISEDGYVAEFEIRNYNVLIHEAKIKATEVHYTNSRNLFNQAKAENNKLLARKAYYESVEATNYFDNYKNNSSIKRQALELGQTHILIESYLSGSNTAFYHTGEIISQMNKSNLNTLWKKYHTHEENIAIDYVATVEVNEIIPGTEREIYNSFIKSKEIIDGKIPVKNKHGKIKKDTLGNTIYKDKKITVQANIEELIREKTSQMSGRIIIIDAKSNQLINTIPINVSYLFEDYSYVYHGDKRALDKNNRTRIKSHCAPFPTDLEMTTNLAYEYKLTAENSIVNESHI